MKKEKIGSKIMYDLNKDHLGTPITATANVFNEMWEVINDHSEKLSKDYTKLAFLEARLSQLDTTLKQTIKFTRIALGIIAGILIAIGLALIL
jgi:hypothetical protein